MLLVVVVMMMMIMKRNFNVHLELSQTGLKNLVSFTKTESEGLSTNQTLKGRRKSHQEAIFFLK